MKNFAWFIQKENTITDVDDKYLNYVRKLNKGNENRSQAQGEQIKHVWNALKENLKSFKQRKHDFNKHLFFDKLVEKEEKMANEFSKLTPSKIEGTLIRSEYFRIQK